MAQAAAAAAAVARDRPCRGPTRTNTTGGRKRSKTFNLGRPEVNQSQLKKHLNLMRRKIWSLVKNQ